MRMKRSEVLWRSFSAAFEDEDSDAYGEVEEGGGPARLSRSSAISSRFEEAAMPVLQERERCREFQAKAEAVEKNTKSRAAVACSVVSCERE